MRKSSTFCVQCIDIDPGLKALSNHNKKVTAQNNEQRRQAIQAEINRKTDQYKTLDAKWFKTSAEKMRLLD